jgi:hypothetical protein
MMIILMIMKKILSVCVRRVEGSGDVHSYHDMPGLERRNAPDDKDISGGQKTAVNKQFSQEYRLWASDEHDLDLDAEHTHLLTDDDLMELEDLYLVYKLSGANRTRQPKTCLQRKDWDVHRYEQISTKEWQGSYHMDPTNSTNCTTFFMVILK